MPRCPSGAVRAATTSTSAIPALVMNILVPSSGTSSHVARPPPACARVVMPATSEPVPGSVTAIAATFSAAMIRARYLACCSAVPKRAMCGAAM